MLLTFLFLAFLLEFLDHFGGEFILFDFSFLYYFFFVGERLLGIGRHSKVSDSFFSLLFFSETLL